MIYVLADADRTCVKIGFSGRSDPVKRCEQLEQSHPKQLVLLLLLHGDRRGERLLHKRFAALRMPDRREWFRFGDEINSWARAEVGIVSQPFYTWLLERRADLNPIGDLARNIGNELDFPKEEQSFFAVESYLDVKGFPVGREVFEKAWRAFLRSAVRRANDTRAPAHKDYKKLRRAVQDRDKSIAQIMSGAVEIAKSRGFSFLTHREIGATLEGISLLAYSLALALAVSAGPARAKSLCATVIQTTGALIVSRQPMAYTPALVRDAHDVIKLMLEL